jgi:hypothetical protein
MRRDEITKEIERLAFDFFYWFSRFEFALKVRGHLKSREPGAVAQPNWEDFVDAWEERYELSEAGSALIAANPKRQIVGPYELEFRPNQFNQGASDLEKVARFARTVRNNLFHGGKHGAGGWHPDARMQELLPLVITVLGELAELAGMQPDYTGYY